jgi:hypothetical protein
LSSGISFGQRGGGGPQASLDLDTAGCPTTFGPPVCEQQTQWSLSKTTTTGTLDNPNNEPFSFVVTVTEGKTTTVLTGAGQIVVTNSGDLSAVLSSIVSNLEKPNMMGTGDAPGPSGMNWDVLATALANESALCGDTAEMCYGTATKSAGASLVLRDPNSNDIIALTGHLPIPPTIDNDGDGERDEDPVDGVDNDGDGLIDEDGACEDAVVINFEYSFDIAGLGLVAGETLRLNLMSTFGSAGSRGGSGASCSADVNCNGVLDVDDPTTPDIDESETDNIRTIQQRLQFLMPECDPVCDAVELSDPGPTAEPPGCVAINTTLNVPAGTMIAATGVEGAATEFMITGTVSCGTGDCSAAVTNEAVLTCSDPSLITGSPATATFQVNCMGGGEPEIDPGDFCTQTQGGWGSSPSPGMGAGNTGNLLHDNFLTIFPGGTIVIGDPDGVDGDGLFAIVLTSAQAVTDFLPTGGTPAALTADLTDPLLSAAGVFAGQLIAAVINVAADAAGVGKSVTPDFPNGTLGTLVFVAGCVDDDLVGLSVNDAIALAHTAISGGGTPAGVTIGDLSDALAALNENFVDCDTDLGCLALDQGGGGGESQPIVGPTDRKSSPSSTDPGGASPDSDSPAASPRSEVSAESVAAATAEVAPNPSSAPTASTSGDSPVTAAAEANLASSTATGRIGFSTPVVALSPGAPPALAGDAGAQDRSRVNAPAPSLGGEGAAPPASRSLTLPPAPPALSVSSAPSAPVERIAGDAAVSPSSLESALQVAEPARSTDGRLVADSGVSPRIEAAAAESAAAVESARSELVASSPPAGIDPTPSADETARMTSNRMHRGLVVGLSLLTALGMGWFIRRRLA